LGIYNFQAFATRADVRRREERPAPVASFVCSLGAAWFLLTGCATSVIEVTDLPSRIDYACANDRTLSVARAPDRGDREIRLTRADSAAQEKYSDGNYSLYLHGERAMLEEKGRVLYGPCVSPVALPKTYR